MCQMNFFGFMKKGRLCSFVVLAYQWVLGYLILRDWLGGLGKKLGTIHHLKRKDLTVMEGAMLL